MNLVALNKQISSLQKRYATALKRVEAAVKQHVEDGDVLKLVKLAAHTGYSLSEEVIEEAIEKALNNARDDESIDLEKHDIALMKFVQKLTNPSPELIMNLSLALWAYGTDFAAIQVAECHANPKKIFKIFFDDTSENVGIGDTFTELQHLLPIIKEYFPQGKLYRRYVALCVEHTDVDITLQAAKVGGYKLTKKQYNTLIDNSLKYGFVKDAHKAAQLAGRELTPEELEKALAENIKGRTSETDARYTLKLLGRDPTERERKFIEGK